MFVSDAGDDEWKQLRVRRGKFVEQAELVQVEMCIVGQRHHAAIRRMVRAQSSALPVKHEFAEQVRKDARGCVESVIDRTVNRQVINGGSIDGNSAAEPSAHKG